MTQCSSLKTQRCDLKHRVRTVIYNYPWPKCCCFYSLRHHSCCGPGSCSCAGRPTLQSLAKRQSRSWFFRPLEPLSFVLQHASPQCQIFLPGYSVCFPLEFLELQVMFYTFTLFFHSSPFSEFGSLGADVLFYSRQGNLNRFLREYSIIQYKLQSELFSLVLAQLLYFSVECEFTYTVQNPFLKQVPFGIYPGCDICFHGAKYIQVTLLQFFWQKS